MRTTLDLENEKITELLSLTGLNNKTRAISVAINSYIKQKKREKLKSLGGAMKIHPVWKQLRELEKNE